MRKQRQHVYHAIVLCESSHPQSAATAEIRDDREEAGCEQLARPYRPQILPLATVLTLIGDRWLEPVVQEKLARWFWCGVFGELYGSATETRIALEGSTVEEWVTTE